MTPPETDPDLPVSVQESGGGVGQQRSATGLGTFSAAVCAWEILKEVTLSLLPPP